MTEAEFLNPIGEILTSEEEVVKGNIKDLYQLLDDAILELDGNASLPVIYIDGMQLSGKTTLAVQAIDYVNKKTSKPIMDLAEVDNLQYAMGGDQFLKKLPEASKGGYRIVVYDEAGDYARKGAMTRFNKTMDIAIDKMRAWKCIIIFICHYFPKQVTSEMIDKGLASCLVHCVSRSPGQTYTSVKVYDKESISYMVNYWIKFVKVPGHIYRLTPNFTFDFHDLTPERSRQLEKLGLKKKKESWDLSEIRLNGLVTQQEIASQLRVSCSWVKQKLRLIEAEADKVYKNRKFYEQTTLEALRKMI